MWWRRHGGMRCASSEWSIRIGWRALDFRILETLFEVLNVRIVVISNQAPEDAQVELVKDMLSVVSRFSAKLYGMRGGRKARAAVKDILAKTGADTVGG